VDRKIKQVACKIASAPLWGIKKILIQSGALEKHGEQRIHSSRRKNRNHLTSGIFFLYQDYLGRTRIR
jgi:hypothetical protein